MSAPAFVVRLDNFEGPFDLLLQLISRRRLDVTEVALSQVTDEFIAYARAGGKVWPLEQTSQFLLVAATLLDLKAARLLPAGEVEDDEDLALLEARDLLFARLLQYRAFQQVAAWIADVLDTQQSWHPRPGGLEPHFAALLPEVELDLEPEELAQLAAAAMTPKALPVVSLEHLHAPAVSVRDEAQVIVNRLRVVRSLSFRSLGSDVDVPVVVARFLALLELFREGAVAFEQVSPLAELTIRWTGTEAGEVEINDEYVREENGTADE
ncbi:segregation and condensation protein A [Enemella sp. A6]|uniref:segregation and condensation protein A n=1 Tax=Enemella sp. A6 TaxID=3440152 RepID=UPI003EBA1E80